MLEWNRQARFAFRGTAPTHREQLTVRRVPPAFRLIDSPSLCPESGWMETFRVQAPTSPLPTRFWAHRFTQVENYPSITITARP